MTSLLGSARVRVRERERSFGMPCDDDENGVGTSLPADRARPRGARRAYLDPPAPDVQAEGDSAPEAPARRAGQEERSGAESAGSPSLVRGGGCVARAGRGGSGGSPSQPGRSPSTSVTAADSRGRGSRGSRGGRAGRAGR